MPVTLRKLSADHWTATYRDHSGEGRGPLSATHDLFEKLRAAKILVEAEETAEGPIADRRLDKRAQDTTS